MRYIIYPTVFLSLLVASLPYPVIADDARATTQASESAAFVAAFRRLIEDDALAQAVERTIPVVRHNASTKPTTQASRLTTDEIIESVRRTAPEIFGAT